MRAYFVEGRAVGRPEVLAEIAAEAGLDPAATLAALDAGEGAEGVAADMAQAARYGIRGVPFFVMGGRLGVSGAQDADTLLDAIAQAA